MLGLTKDSSLAIAPQIIIKRNSDVDWSLIAPFGDGEWMLSKLDLQTLSRISPQIFEELQPKQTRLLFYSMTVSNKNGELTSSIPVLRTQALRELCRVKVVNAGKHARGVKNGFRQGRADPS